MNVASLELCKTLYELSDWYDTSSGFCWSTLGVKPYLIADTDRYGDTEFPAYDLGFMLRKLPVNRAFEWTDEDTKETREYRGNVFVGYTAQSTAVAGYHGSDASFHLKYADTPEDALAKLCIELLKQGILTKETS